MGGIVMVDEQKMISIRNTAIEVHKQVRWNVITELVAICLFFILAVLATMQLYYMYGFLVVSSGIMIVFLFKDKKTKDYLEKKYDLKKAGP